MTQRRRLVSIVIPAPDKGAFHDMRPTHPRLPRDGARRVENIRVDGGFGRSRDGSVAAAVNDAVDDQGAETGADAVFTAGSTAVTGTTTTFQTDYAVGEYIRAGAHTDDAFTKIAAIPTQTSITLDIGYRGATAGAGAHNRGTRNTNAVVDLFNLPFPDEGVEAIDCRRNKTYRFSNGAYIAISGAANTWAGADTDKFWAVTAPFGTEEKGRVYMSNGIDNIRSWAGGSNDLLNYITGASASFDSARYAIVGDDNRLFFADLLDGSTGGRATQDVAWGVIANTAGAESDYTAVGSGRLSLRNDGWDITGLWKQFGRIYVGKKRAICALVPTGIATDAYGYETLQSNGEGLFAPRSLVQHGNFVAFLTHRGFSLFDGTSLTNITGEMQRDLLRRLNQDALAEITAVFDALNNRVGWGLPMDGSGEPNEIWWFDVDGRKWEVDKVTHRAFSLFTAVDVTTIDELTGTIDALTGSIDSLSGTSSDRDRIIYGTNVGEVKIFDEAATTDDGTTITGTYESPAVDIRGAQLLVAGKQHVVNPSDHLVLDSVEVSMLDRGQNTALTLEASGDGGQTWTNLGFLLLVSSVEGRLATVALHTRLSLRDSVMFRLRNASVGVKWGWTEIVGWVDVVGRKR